MKGPRGVVLYGRWVQKRHRYPNSLRWRRFFGKDYGVVLIRFEDFVNRYREDKIDSVKRNKTPLKICTQRKEYRVFRDLSSSVQEGKTTRRVTYRMLLTVPCTWVLIFHRTVSSIRTRISVRHPKPEVGQWIVDILRLFQ